MSHFPGPVPRGKILNQGNNARGMRLYRADVFEQTSNSIRQLVRMLGMNSVWVVSIGRCTVWMWGDSCRKAELVTRHH
jgi:hypothetical protein